MENQQENQEEPMKLKKIISFALFGGDIPVGKHLTLWFKPRGDERLEWIKRLGQEISYEEICILQDQNVITVVCQLQDDELYRGSSLPHVTMETFGDATPVLSNDLIQQEMHSNAFSLRNADATFERKAFLSAMYYTKEGKQYSTTIEDWRV